MKALTWILLPILLCSTSLPLAAQTRANGWYHVLDINRNSLSEEPILTVKDFAALRLDSGMYQSGEKCYMIVGEIKACRVDAWADATEKAIGCHIAFVFKDAIISAPQVNCRIEGGRFSISTLEGHNLVAIYESLQKEKSDLDK